MSAVQHVFPGPCSFMLEFRINSSSLWGENCALELMRCFHVLIYGYSEKRDLRAMAGRQKASLGKTDPWPPLSELQCGTEAIGERSGIENKGKGTMCCRCEPNKSLYFPDGGVHKASSLQMSRRYLHIQLPPPLHSFWLQLQNRGVILRWSQTLYSLRAWNTEVSK